MTVTYVTDLTAETQLPVSITDSRLFSGRERPSGMGARLAKYLPSAPGGSAKNYTK
ncbi:hypothetical protein J2853_005645 [Streptosporangium lutulentum]|uniref:Uncharacterized protein n=1 Tax=Streptosporangium lutulentum TaxID=1461250 RepID=A0ABT9QIB9_9ACTN|nr:hypothetical protein [Streptosporangium lutulentum]